MTIAWTSERKLEHALSLPWTVQVTTEDGEFVARVAELPAVVGCGETEKELQASLYLAMEAVLEVMLEHGDLIQPPANVVLPWLAGFDDTLGDITYFEIDLQADSKAFEHIRASATATVSHVPSLAHA